MHTFKKISLLIIVLFLIMIPVSSQAQWGKALHFSWWEHDRVIVPETSNLFPLQLDAGTIEMWFKPDSLLASDTHAPDYTYLFSKNVSGNVKGDMGLSWKRGQGEIQCFTQDGAVTQDVFTDIAIWEPRWYHIAFVWDTQDSMKIFIDGKQQTDVEPNEAGEVVNPVYGGDQLMVLGSGAANLLDARFETFRGIIDEVRLSAIARYKSNFDLATEPFQPDIYTLALWHFDEGEGDVAEDATGNGFTGVLGDPDSLGHADPEWVKVERVVQPKLIVNEVLIDPASDVANGDANKDGVRQAQHDEFVELINITADSLDLTGWKVGDDERIDFQFPDGYKIGPYDIIAIFGGGDVSNLPGFDPDSMKTKVFATGDSIGNGLANGGDYLIVQSANGDHDIYFAYNSKFNAGPPTSDAVQGIDWEFEIHTAAIGNNNNSLTRSPDGNIKDEDPFVEHLSVSTMPFSPLTTVDGNSQLTFTLTTDVSPGSGGMVVLDPEQTSYAPGSIITVKAEPGDGYVFDSWSGDLESTSNPVTVILDQSKTLTANFAPVFSVAPKIIVNEILADPSGDPILGDANGDGVRHGSQDEFVELVNIGTEPVDMTGWKLGDDEQLSFTFPDNYIMQPGQLVVIFGGGDISKVAGYNADPLQTRVFVSDSTDKVGNGLANGGDFFLLFSPDGSYDLYAGYNSKYNSGGPTSPVVDGITFEARIETAAIANNNNSITRSPDGDISVNDPFVEHLTVSTKPFSPGQTIDGKDVLTAVDENELNGTPKSYELNQNYPNPFNPETRISFYLEKNSQVTLKIFNLQGKLVRSLTQEEMPAGRHRVNWNGRDNRGNLVPSGVYVYQILAGDFKASRKMVLMK